MEIVNDTNFKRIIHCCGPLNSGKPRAIGQYGRFLIVGFDSSIFMWFDNHQGSKRDDASPSFRSTEMKSEFMSPQQVGHGLAGMPLIRKGPSCPSDDNRTLFDSLVLLPFGNTQSNESIRSTDVFESDRVLVGCILSTKRLLLATDSAASEDCPFAPIAFNIDHLLPLTSLISPATVHISSNGARIFITDNQSDLVLEFRFDYSLVAPDRGCPDFSLVHWYLESAIPIGTNTRVTLVNPDNPSDPPSLQVISGVNNGNSQGVVALVNQRRWLPSSKPTKTPICSISFSSKCVLVNTPNYLKLIHLDKGPDFPITIRPPATKTALCPSGTYLSLYAGIITAFRTDSTGSVVPVSISGLTECVDSFAIDPVVGKSAVIIVRGDPTVLRIYALDGSMISDHIQFTFVSQHILPSSVSWLSINQFQEWLCITEPDGRVVCSNCEPLDQLSVIKDHPNSFTAAALCDDWVALAYIVHENLCLEIYALHEPTIACTRFDLPPTSIHQLRFETVTVNGRKENILYGIAGHVVVLRRHFLRGTLWELVPNNLSDSLCVLIGSDTEEDSTRGVFVDTTNPFRVYESKIESLPRTGANVILQSFVACVDDIRGEINWALLPESLRATIEPLVAIEKYPDTVRSTDFACRRYLIEVAFAREFPDVMRVSTEALAWAAISETQIYIVQQISDAATLTWHSLAKTGIGYWCNEIGSVKTLVESIQKNSLQEYIKSKDPQLLEEKVAIWLSVLGKQQLLSTLYKQYGNSCASSVHVKIGQFLTTDFSDPEHAGKAKKNAFELLRQKRYFLAVSMFILGGCFREALDVCCRQLDDVQLALFIAKALKAVGNRVERDLAIDPLIEYLWNERIIDSSDKWMDLLNKASMLDLDGATNLLRSRDEYPERAESPIVGEFASPNFGLNLHSAAKLLEVLKERMRRLNRHYEAAIPHVSDAHIASGYLARGLPSLAKSATSNAHEQNQYLVRAIELEISN